MEKIILLHGALGHSAELQPLALSLQKRGLETELFNFSGHGKKQFSGDFSINGFAAELQQFIKDQGDIGIHLFGYSMGGYVALHMLNSVPFNGSLFTLGTRLTWGAEFTKGEIEKLNPEKMEQKIPAFALKLKEAHGDWKELVRKTAGLIEDLGRNNYLQDTTLSAIKNHVCLGLGDKDNMADVSDTLRVSKVIKNGEMYMLPGTRHQIESADTELLAEIISTRIRR